MKRQEKTFIVGLLLLIAGILVGFFSKETTINLVCALLYTIGGVITLLNSINDSH